MKIGQSRFLLKCVSCVVCIFFLLTLVEVVVLFEITLLVLIDFGKIPFNAIEKNTYHMVYPCILTNMWKIVEVFLFLHSFIVICLVSTYHFLYIAAIIKYVHPQNMILLFSIRINTVHFLISYSPYFIYDSFVDIIPVPSSFSCCFYTLVNQQHNETWPQNEDVFSY